MQHPIDELTSYRKNAFIIGIILGTLLIGSLLFLLLFQKSQAEHSLTALVYQNGKLIHTIDLSKVETPYTITVPREDGGYNLLEVRPGSVGMVDASCPDKLCVHMGFQESSLLPITCLPNNVVIRIVQNTDSLKGTDLDATAY